MFLSHFPGRSELRNKGNSLNQYEICCKRSIFFGIRYYYSLRWLHPSSCRKFPTKSSLSMEKIINTYSVGSSLKTSKKSFRDNSRTLEKFTDCAKKRLFSSVRNCLSPKKSPFYVKISFPHPVHCVTSFVPTIRWLLILLPIKISTFPLKTMNREGISPSSAYFDMDSNFHKITL